MTMTIQDLIQELETEKKHTRKIGSSGIEDSMYNSGYIDALTFVIIRLKQVKMICRRCGWKED